MELINPPEGQQKVWKLRDIVLGHEFRYSDAVFKLIDGPKELNMKWTMRSWNTKKSEDVTKGIGLLRDLWHILQNMIPDAVDVYHLEDSLDRMTLKRKLDSIDWYSIKSRQKGYLAMLTLIRAKVVAGNGIKLWYAIH